MQNNYFSSPREIVNAIVILSVPYNKLLPDVPPNLTMSYFDGDSQNGIGGIFGRGIGRKNHRTSCDNFLPVIIPPPPVIGGGK